VANTGRPIEKAELARIFERFRRLDEARESGGGYGLGLAIAKGVAVSHGGSIRAESEGGWNRFVVELPLSRARRFSFFKGKYGSVNNTNKTGRNTE
jgi:two-component system heavy metal sensor histidine kinase CusS